jgi:hypothetical protein
MQTNISRVDKRFADGFASSLDPVSATIRAYWPVLIIPVRRMMGYPREQFVIDFLQEKNVLLIVFLHNLPRGSFPFHAIPP